MPDFNIGQCVFIHTSSAYGNGPSLHPYVSGYAVVLRSDDQETTVELWPSDLDSLWVQIGEVVVWSEERPDEGILSLPTADVFSAQDVGFDLEPGCGRPTPRESAE